MTTAVNFTAVTPTPPGAYFAALTRQVEEFLGDVGRDQPNVTIGVCRDCLCLIPGYADESEGVCGQCAADTPTLFQQALAIVAGLNRVRPCTLPRAGLCAALVAERRKPRRSVGFGSYGMVPEHQCTRRPASGDIFCAQHRRSIDEEANYRRRTDPKYPGYAPRV